MAIRTVSGSTTDHPIQDGAFRASLLAVVLGLVNVAINRLNLELTEDETAIAMTIAAWIALVLAGAWDKWVKPRLA